MDPDDTAERQTTAREALAELIGSLRDEANRLEALLKQLPESFTREADEALWELVIQWKR